MLLAIYDLEIAKAIPPKNTADRIDGIEYCGGWDDFRGMGIACWAMCILDSDTGEIRNPDAGTTITDFIIKQREYWDIATAANQGYMPIGGFNSRKFDDQLISTGNALSLASDFDILDLVLEAAGDKGTKYWQAGRRYSLATIGEANGYAKTLSGELAPIEWQKGNHQLVIDYCKNDVVIEARTLLKLLRGELINPNTGEVLPAVDLNYLLG